MRVHTSSPPAVGPWGRLRAFAELTKPRIGLLLLAVAACSYYLGSGRNFDGSRFAVLLIGVSLLAAGVLSLNQYFERERDGHMHRTRGRPLPSGRLRPHEALTFGMAGAAASVLLFALAVNLVSAAVALFTLVSYILVYTPLKTRTAYHTTLGALSGGTPTLLGWAAARGSLEPAAWVLFALLFFWQFPHFLAINLMYREDYARAGIRVLPGEDPHGRRTAAAIIAPAALLLASSLLLVPMGLLRPIYAAAAVPLGGLFFFVAVRVALRQEKREGRLLLKASVLYLPCILLAMALTLA
jgi:protoheme IX farnesyltransferase